MPRKIPYETRENIKRLRSKGLSYAKVAKELGISFTAAYTYANDLDRSVPTVSWEGVVRNHDSLTLENGLNGGFIATVGDYTGDECKSMASAIRSALEKKGARLDGRK